MGLPDGAYDYWATSETVGCGDGDLLGTTCQYLDCHMQYLESNQIDYTQDMHLNHYSF